MNYYNLTFNLKQTSLLTQLTVRQLQHLREYHQYDSLSGSRYTFNQLIILKCCKLLREYLKPNKIHIILNYLANLSNNLKKSDMIVTHHINDMLDNHFFNDKDLEKQIKSTTYLTDNVTFYDELLKFRCSKNQLLKKDFENCTLEYKNGCLIIEPSNDFKLSSFKLEVFYINLDAIIDELIEKIDELKTVENFKIRNVKVA